MTARKLQPFLSEFSDKTFYNIRFPNKNENILYITQRNFSILHVYLYYLYHLFYLCYLYLHYYVLFILLHFALIFSCALKCAYIYYDLSLLTGINLKNLLSKVLKSGNDCILISLQYFSESTCPLKDREMCLRRQYGRITDGKGQREVESREW